MAPTTGPATKEAVSRREFVAGTGLTLTVGLLSTGCEAWDGGSRQSASRARRSMEASDWQAVRDQFQLAPDKVHLAALLISAHSRPVREAIEQYRRELDADPVHYLQNENDRKKDEARAAAGRYLGARASEIALTDSTTMGIALVYHGLALSPGDEVLTTDHDYYATHESLRLVADRTGAHVRQVRLHEQSDSASADEIVANLLRGITPRTRAIALTWVHSSTGLKLPIGEISRAVREMERRLGGSEPILICVDGVHGFGVEDFDVATLGCDFFMAGCHKWLFGPRGTGIVWGRAEAWARVQPTIPSFSDGEAWNAWARDREPTGPTTAARMSPGGFKPFEHQWAIADAIRFHEEIGKDRVAARTHELNDRLKEGLAAMRHVRLLTPRAEELSSGIVCFQIDGLSERAVVDRLRQRGIVATTTPYAESYPRLTPCLYNSAEDIEIALREIRDLG